MKKIKFNLIAFLRNIGLKKETIKRIFKWKDGWRNEFCSEFEKGNVSYHTPKGVAVSSPKFTNWVNNSNKEVTVNPR